MTHHKWQAAAFGRSTCPKAILVTLAMCLACSAVVAAPPREVTDEDIDRAIEQAQRFLWSRQADSGHFSNDGANVPAGGPTALAVFALLEAGGSPNDPRMQKALDALVELKTENLYVVAVRTMALAQVVGSNKESKFRQPLDADLKWLTEKAPSQGAAWGYAGPERTGDNSCSQFALLALWEADLAHQPVSADLVGRVEKTWLSRQRPDGGWTYAGQPQVKTDSTDTMTAAGLASLFICQDVLTNTCGPYAHPKAVAGAWKFLASGLSQKPDYIANEYLAFCVQRIGLASGAKFIGEMDWFAVGAAKLAEPNPYGRSYGSQWGSTVRAAMELIFLARGRNPLTFNKLQHGQDDDWNAHTRDVPHFTEHMRRNFERRMRWQVVRPTDEVKLLLDAPILLVTGLNALDLPADQWEKLRDYTLRGGTLLFVPTHNSKAFLEDATAHLKDLYQPQRELTGGAGPSYALEPLPADHPVYNLLDKVPNGPVTSPMWGVSDGTRLLAVVTRNDICCSWQRRALATGRNDYALGVNFLLYATGASAMKMRLRPVFASAGGEVRSHARLAWLKHGGNWCTQPAALDSLGAKLTAENRVSLDVTAGVAIAPDALLVTAERAVAGKSASADPATAPSAVTSAAKGYHLAWMTGSAEFKLTEAELAALRQYLDGGGTLFVNAVGGSDAFNRSAGEMLEKLFAGRDVVGRPPAASSPLVTGKCDDFRGPPLGKFQRTRAWEKTASGAPTMPPLRLYEQQGRAVVIYAPQGVHDTLDGHTAHGAISYMPPSARDIAANIVLYSLVQKPP